MVHEFTTYGLPTVPPDYNLYGRDFVTTKKVCKSIRVAHDFILQCAYVACVIVTSDGAPGMNPRMTLLCQTVALCCATICLL